MFERHSAPSGTSQWAARATRNDLQISWFGNWGSSGYPPAKWGA